MHQVQGGGKGKGICAPAGMRVSAAWACVCLQHGHACVCSMGMRAMAFSPDLQACVLQQAWCA